MIRHIVLDFGKVLVDYDVYWLFDKLFGSHEEAVWFNETVTNPDWCASVDKEEIPWHENISRLKVSWPEYAEVIEAFDRRFQETVGGEVAGMRELLTELKGRGYGLWGLSNWSSKVYETISTHGVFGLLDGMMISCEEKLVKPDVAIYRRFLRKFGLKAEECVFLDDRPVNIEGCERAGMRGIVFENAAQARRRLREFGVPV